MTTPIYPSITDDLLAELEDVADRLDDEFLDERGASQVRVTADTIRMLSERIRELEARQWVPVSERLPVLRDDAVLVYWPASGAIETVHIEDYFGDITCGLDADGNQLYTKWYLSHGVTHWMPLPDPPKEDA